MGYKVEWNETFEQWDLLMITGKSQIFLLGFTSKSQAEEHMQRLRSAHKETNKITRVENKSSRKKRRKII